jgi:hypothetical protein
MWRGEILPGGSACDGGAVSSGGQTRPILDRRFEIEFLDAGVERFAFTFG